MSWSQMKSSRIMFWLIFTRPTKLYYVCHIFI
jgi:hypothetical protein